MVSTTAARSPAAAIARSADWSATASGVVACASFGSAIPPILEIAVLISPVRVPAASRAATASMDVVVLPSVPVTPTTARSRLGSPYHQAADRARAAGLPATTSWGRATSGTGRSTIAAAAPRAAALATNS